MKPEVWWRKCFFLEKIQQAKHFPKRRQTHFKNIQTCWPNQVSNMCVNFSVKLKMYWLKLSHRIFERHLESGQNLCTAPWEQRSGRIFQHWSGGGGGCVKVKDEHHPQWRNTSRSWKGKGWYSYSYSFSGTYPRGYTRWRKFLSVDYIYIPDYLSIYWRIVFLIILKKSHSYPSWDGSGTAVIVFSQLCVGRMYRWRDQHSDWTLRTDT